MKTSLKTAIFMLLFGLMVIGAVQVKAQCAQCAAQVETNKSNGGSMANGLNNGIMFLLAAPYIAVAVGGFVWYKKYRKKNVDLNMHKEKLNLN